jgi:hypothetical protein
MIATKAIKPMGRRCFRVRGWDFVGIFLETGVGVDGLALFFLDK